MRILHSMRAIPVDVHTTDLVVTNHMKYELVGTSFRIPEIACIASFLKVNNRKRAIEGHKLYYLHNHSKYAKWDEQNVK